MKNYHRLTFAERVKIEEFKNLKYSVSKIAKKLNRAKSTIARELKNQPLCTLFLQGRPRQQKSILQVDVQEGRENKNLLQSKT